MNAKTYLFLFAAAISLCLCGAAIAAAASGNLPVITTLQPRYEFEPVPEGVEVRHDFVIRNQGGSNLEIQNVETG
jgi:hypothetical protein